RQQTTATQGAVPCHGWLSHSSPGQVIFRVLPAPPGMRSSPSACGFQSRKGFEFAIVENKHVLFGIGARRETALRRKARALSRNCLEQGLGAGKGIAAAVIREGLRREGDDQFAV